MTDEQHNERNERTDVLIFVILIILNFRNFYQTFYSTLISIDCYNRFLLFALMLLFDTIRECLCNLHPSTRFVSRVVDETTFCCRDSWYELFSEQSSMLHEIYGHIVKVREKSNRGGCISSFGSPIYTGVKRFQEWVYGEGSKNRNGQTWEVKGTEIETYLSCLSVSKNSARDEKRARRSLYDRFNTIAIELSNCN